MQTEVIEPFGSRVLVEADEEKVTVAGAEELQAAPMDRNNARLERPYRGRVIAVGPKTEYVKEGDIVYFGKYSNDEIEVNKKKLYFLDEDKLAGKVIFK